MAEVDLGYKPKKDEFAVGPNEPYHPHSFWLRDGEPEKLGVKDAKIGDTVTIPVTFKVTSISMSEDNKTGSTHNMTLTAMSATVGEKEAEKAPLHDRMYKKA